MPNKKNNNESKGWFCKVVQRFSVYLLFSSSAFFSCNITLQEKKEEITIEPQDTTMHLYKNGLCVDSLTVKEYTIGAGDYLGNILSDVGFDPQAVDRIIRETADVLDPRKLQVGMHYTTYHTKETPSQLKYLTFRKTATNYAIIEFSDSVILSYSYKKPVRLERRYAEGVIDASLWNVLKRAGTNPLLALHLSDVYAWQIDFFDVKDGDSFKVMYDVAFVDDTTELHIASIEGASFTHQGKEYVAIPFTQDSIREYYDADGQSLRKAFLKAPLDFFRISSRFSNARFHPVLKIYRPHHGVDYAAPKGTPVKSIGSGKVIAKAYQRSGAGYYLKIKHNSVYTTTYMHLSGFAKGLQVGKTVQQGEVIGYVGSTGLSTGAHLDFRVYKNGQPINPLHIEAPPLKPVSPELKDSFMRVKERIWHEMKQSFSSKK